MRKLLISLAVAGGLLLTASAQAASPWSHRDSNGQTVVDLYFFWSKSCVHCHRALPFVKDIARKNRWVKLHNKEVTNDNAAVDHYLKLTELTDGEAGSVPAFFYCGQMFTGFGEADTTGAWLFDELKTCRSNPETFNIQH